jgi:hypothetical protein
LFGGLKIEAAARALAAFGTRKCQLMPWGRLTGETLARQPLEFLLSVLWMLLMFANVRRCSAVIREPNVSGANDPIALT